MYFEKSDFEVFATTAKKLSDESHIISPVLEIGTGIKLPRPSEGHSIVP